MNVFLFPRQKLSRLAFWKSQQIRVLGKQLEQI